MGKRKAKQNLHRVFVNFSRQRECSRVSGFCHRLLSARASSIVSFQFAAAASVSWTLGMIVFRHISEDQLSFSMVR